MISRKLRIGEARDLMLNPTADSCGRFEGYLRNETFEHKKPH